MDTIRKKDKLNCSFELSSCIPQGILVTLFYFSFSESSFLYFLLFFFVLCFYLFFLL